MYIKPSSIFFRLSIGIIIFLVLGKSIRAEEEYDLMFIIDATASMSTELEKIREALPQIFNLVRLTRFLDQVSVLAFRDYNDGKDKLIEWSHWKKLANMKNLEGFVKSLTAFGGGDLPEAIKTALIRACKEVEKQTICIILTDNFPHHQFKDIGHTDNNYANELKELGETNFDWNNICQKVKDSKMQVYTFLVTEYIPLLPFYGLLAKTTGGDVIYTTHDDIVKTTIGVLLSLCGIEFEHAKDTKGFRLPNDFDYIKAVSPNSTPISQNHTSQNYDLEIKSIDCLQSKVKNIADKFKSDEEYQKIVFDTFNKIMSENNVMTFTYNKVFGILWIEICKLRKDTRRKDLEIKLSQCVNKVSKDDKIILKNFIYDIYDKTEEINSIIENIDGPFYIIKGEKQITRRELYAIRFNCSKEVLGKIPDMIRSIEIIEHKPTAESEMTYIPVNISPTQFFAILPHLLCDNSMFEIRESAILAAITYDRCRMLRPIAFEFFKENRHSKWFVRHLDENKSLSIARLLMKVGEFAFDDEDWKYLKAFVQVGTLINNGNTEIEVAVKGYRSQKTLRLDHKEQCKRCKQWRSLTMILDDTCALCIKYPDMVNVELNKLESYMCTCIKCDVHYAVYRLDKLKGKNTKCHFCRIGKDTECVECNKCASKFLYQKKKKPETFTCKECEKNAINSTHKITIKDYIEINGAGIIGMSIENPEFFFSSNNKLSKITDIKLFDYVRNFEEMANTDLKPQKVVIDKIDRGVLRVEELHEQILDALKPKHEECSICFALVYVKKLKPICGNTLKGCHATACSECSKKWYNRNYKGGKIYLPALKCAICFNPPIIRVIKEYNQNICGQLKRISEAFDEKKIYAWCIKCDDIKIYGTVVCGGEDIELNNYMCDDCSGPIESMERKKCPGCGVLTDKNGGCNHMTCPVMNCRAHWCWTCQYLGDDHCDIYLHLEECNKNQVDIGRY